MDLNFGSYAAVLAPSAVPTAPLVVGHYLEDASAIKQALQAQGLECHLAAVSGVSEADLLPYPRPELGARFASAHAAQYYHTLTTTILPDLKAQLPHSGALILVGYSLAGLFALWALTQPNCPFTRVISCSGSLWYPEAARALTLPPKATVHSVYLSLGDKESTKGPRLFRSVGSATAQAYEYYRTRCPCTYELNPGGQFDQVTTRLVQGIAWTLQQGAAPHPPLERSSE